MTPSLYRIVELPKIWIPAYAMISVIWIIILLSIGCHGTQQMGRSQQPDLQAKESQIVSVFFSLETGPKKEVDITIDQILLAEGNLKAAADIKKNDSQLQCEWLNQEKHVVHTSWIHNPLEYTLEAPLGGGQLKQVPQEHARGETFGRCQYQSGLAWVRITNSQGILLAELPLMQSKVKKS